MPLNDVEYVGPFDYMWMFSGLKNHQTPLIVDAQFENYAGNA